MIRLDFFGRRAHYIDHLAPIWNALPPTRRGTFYVVRELETYARQELHEPSLGIWTGGALAGDNPILTAAYGDLNKVIRNPARRLITMEHGVTQGFGTAAYPNGTIGNRDRVDLALLPNEYVAKHFRAVRQTRYEVIGTPKMDAWIDPGRAFPLERHLGHPVIAIAFHWGDRHAQPPESGSAFEHYKGILLDLARRFKVIGHGHPLAAEIYKAEFERLGIEWVEDFRDVLRRADLYINDLSSTMYEFLVTGKPVVILNAPWFRRNVHWGIRFWDYADVGINVESPFQLFDVIGLTLEQYGTICAEARHQAVTDLYPHAGCSAQRAVEVLEGWLDEQS